MTKLDEATDTALDDAYFDLDEEDQEFEVLLVGGTTRLQLVREWVLRKFKKAPDTRVEPDEVTALGAALFAG